MSQRPKELLCRACEFADSLDRVIIIAIDKNGEGHYAISSDDEDQVRKDIAKFKRDQKK